jgi:hypothetical protein
MSISENWFSFFSVKKLIKINAYGTLIAIFVKWSALLSITCSFKTF